MIDHQAERMYRARFVVISVADLPRDEPFRTGCMPEVRHLRWRYLGARVRPRPPSDCCWYHGGSWREVNAQAIRLLAAIRTTDDLDEDVARMMEAAVAEGVHGWQREALSSLFLAPIVLAQDDDEYDGRPWYVNGQHRGRAMRDAGVARTVIRVDEPVADEA